MHQSANKNVKNSQIGKRISVLEMTGRLSYTVMKEKKLLQQIDY